MPEWAIPLLSLTGVVITGIFAFITGRAGGTAVKDIATASSTLIKPLEDRITALETSAHEKDTRITTLERELGEERRKRQELSLTVEVLEEKIAGLSSENGHLRLEKARLEKELSKRGGGSRDTL